MHIGHVAVSGGHAHEVGGAASWAPECVVVPLLAEGALQDSHIRVTGAVHCVVLGDAHVVRLVGVHLHTFTFILHHVSQSQRDIKSTTASFRKVITKL